MFQVIPNLLIYMLDFVFLFIFYFYVRASTETCMQTENLPSAC